MGVTKKPAVVAKTAPKKRGRPVGSKGKKKISLSSEGWVPHPVEWEKLSRLLQEALAAEMRECETYKRLFEELQKNACSVQSLSIWKRIKLAVTGKY